MSREQQAGSNHQACVTALVFCLKEAMLTRRCAGEGELLSFLLEVV